MNNPRNNTMSPSIKVKDIKKSVDFYTNTLGFKASETLTRKDGKIAHSQIIGFDSPVLMLSPVEFVRTPLTKDDLTKNKLGVGVEFHIGMNGSIKLDEFFTEVKKKGAAVVNEPTTEYWGNRTFTINDPDGYALTFSEHISDVSVEDRLSGFEAAHRK